MTPNNSSANTRRGQIYSLGLPIILGQLSQSLTSLIDTAMVAALDDSNALAAVAIGSYANYLACAFVLGFSVSVQAMTARRMGEGSTQHVFVPLNAGIQLSLLVGLCLTLLFYSSAPWLMSALNNDPAVNRIATDYFRYRCLGIAAIGFSFACRGYWSGIKQTTVLMWVVLFVQLSNIITSYCLIYGSLGAPTMGAAGSGLGSTLGISLGALLYLWWTFRGRWHWLFMRPPATTYHQVLKLALPNSSQQFLSALAMAVFYYILGQISVETLAIGHALTNVALFMVLPAHGFGIGATTLVSQALGEKDRENAYQWGWDSVREAQPLLFVLALPLWFIPDTVIQLFIPDSPRLLEMAHLPVQMTGLIILCHSSALILSQSLLGAGDNRRVFISFSLLQWLFFLPVSAIAVLLFQAGIEVIWGIILIDRILQSMVFIVLWRQKQWAHHYL